MKKLALIATAAFLSVAAVSAFVYVNNGKNSMGELFNANVEALTRSESGGFGSMCSQTGKWGNYRMKLCSACNGPVGDYAMDYVAFCN